MKSSHNIVFFGTPEIAVRVLENLLESNIQISSVITRPDKPKGRGQALSLSPVKQAAVKHKISVYQPSTKAELTETLKKLNPDIGIVAAYGMIIPEDALKVPAFGLINFHPSLLPLLRGPAPVSMAIMCGHKETGVTVMNVSAGMDEGDILAQQIYPLSGKETTPELELTLADLGSKMIVEILPKIFARTVKPTPQDHQKATYTKMVKKEDGEISWDKYYAKNIEQAYRAFIPWPGIYTYFKGKKLDLFEVEYVEKELKPGVVFKDDQKILIGTKKCAVSVGALKIEGKKKVPALEFTRGYPDFIGTNLIRK